LELFIEDAHEVLAIENGNEEDESYESEEVRRETPLASEKRRRG